MTPSTHDLPGPEPLQFRSKSALPQTPRLGVRARSKCALANVHLAADPEAELEIRYGGENWLNPEPSEPVGCSLLAIAAARAASAKSGHSGFGARTGIAPLVTPFQEIERQALVSSLETWIVGRTRKRHAYLCLMPIVGTR